MHRVFLALLAVVATIAFPSEAYADDSCVACGRLIILIVGAGETPNPNPYKPDAPEYRYFDPLGNDSLEYDAIGHLKQFSALPSGKLPVQVILISSDASLKKKAESLSKASKSTISVLPNSLDSLKRLTESEDSELRRAIRRFETASTCKELMRQRHLTSVLPLIKVDFLVDSHFSRENSECGISTWSLSSRSGSGSEWRADGGKVLTKQLWKNLTDKVSGSTTQMFFSGCKAGRLASIFENYSNDNSPSCFVASTNQTQDDYGGGGFRPTFNNAIRDGIRFKETFTNTWDGARNIIDMVPDLYNKFEGMIFPKDAGSNPYRLIANTNLRNPLVGFIYTSADALAEEGFKKIGEISDDTAFVEHPTGLAKAEVKALSSRQNFRENAQGAFYAQATDELPSIGADSGSSEMVKRIEEQIAAINRSFAFIYQEDDGIASTAGEFKKHYTSFGDCASESSEQPSDCKDLDAYFDSIFKLNTPSENEEKFKNSYIAFADALKVSRPHAAWKAYTAHQISLGELFENLHRLRMAYLDLVRDFSEVVKDAGESAEVKRHRQTFDRMTGDFEAAFSAIREPICKAFRKDALRLKLAKIEIATRLVAQHGDALQPGYADEFLKKMSRKLDLLTKVPVGPMFDKEAAALNARR
jgi:hypothetical protein